jgi:tryptophan-rich hypothetical protein
MRLMTPPTTARPTHSSGGTPSRNNPLSPKKLLLTKWTAVAPQQREKHFVVLRVLLPEPPAARIDEVELQAVHSGRCFVLPWRELTDAVRWRQGWL